MKSFLFSFYGKLSALLLLLLLIMGIAQFYITYQASQKFMNSANQRVNVHLAENMAAELEPLLQDTMSVERIKSAIHYMMVFNPRIEIYVLNEEGDILAYFADPPRRVQADNVNLEPVKSFIKGSYDELILGEDPRNPEKKKPFSAARLQIGPDGFGYLYIILASEQYYSALNMMQDNYIFQTAIKISILILGVTAVIGLVIFALLARRLRKMTDKVEAFERGNLDVTLHDNSRDEIGQLARSFNRMVATIKTNVEKLEKTDQLRRDLIANVSHDLRSPLASMQGYLETILMKQASLSKKEREKYLNVVMKNTRLLRKLVEDLFELSRLDAKQVQPKIEPFSIAELVQDVILKLDPRAQEKKVTLNHDLGRSLPHVEADIGLIERALTNLLDNAIKHTSVSGHVLVELKKNGEAIEIKVKDTGDGINKEDLPHIFDRFYRADKSRSLTEGSTGLGLAIAQKIVELHGSKITVDSEPGKGTIFSFGLPVYR